MTSILYIGNPKSIHDVKWASFFSEKKEVYKVYFLSEKEVCADVTLYSKLLKEKDIELLDSLDSFSISKPFKTLKSILYLRKTIKKHNIDIVHVLFSAPFSLWTIFTAKPSVITNRGSDILIEIPKLLHQGVKGRLFYKLFTKAFRKSTITGTSQRQVEKVNTLFGLDAELIRTGVDVSRIVKLTKDINRKKIIFSPRYFKQIYNIELQIEAIKKLPLSIIQNYEFVFIKGKNPNLRYAHKLERELALLKEEKQLNYNVIESLSQEEMFVYYGKASLTIMTPHSDGTPNSALEAMSAKSPLIVPQLNYDKQLFTNTCLILEENDPLHLAKLMQESVINYDNKLIDNAFEAVSKYGNREVEMKKLENLYASMY